MARKQRLTLAEFINHIRTEVGDEMIKSCCPQCYGTGAISNSHQCDWRSFYAVFKGKPEVLIANLKHNKELYPTPVIEENP